MNIRDLKITAATICLNSLPYRFEHRNGWAWDIIFENVPIGACLNIVAICMGKTQQEARSTWREIKKMFLAANIKDNSKVTVIFDENGVIAIGKNDSSHYIDVEHNFKLVPFSELGIYVNSLSLLY